MTEPCYLHLKKPEKRLSRLLCTEHSYKEIAKEIGLHHVTVKRMSAALYRVFGARGREHFMAMMLLPLDSPLRWVLGEMPRAISRQTGPRPAPYHMTNMKRLMLTGYTREQAKALLDQIKDSVLDDSQESVPLALLKRSKNQMVFDFNVKSVPETPRLVRRQVMPVPKTFSNKIAALMRMGYSYVDAMNIVEGEDKQTA
jgi:DNA-binding CsgD family transcriptional regulator